MSEKTTTQTGGIGFAGLLTILFIGLKLTHNIVWSWWWVLSPLWISAVVVLAFLGGLALVVGVVAIFEHRKDKKRREERLAGLRR